MRRRRTVLAVLAVVFAAAGTYAFAQAGTEGRIGAALHLLNNGRHVQPLGKLVTIGQFPTGGALTPDGRWYWTISTGRGPNDIRIVSVRSARVLQTIRLPGASGGIAIDPTKPVVYVSGVADSSGRKLQETPPGTPGERGDVIHVFTYNPHTGSATYKELIPVPPPSGSPTPQNFPPTNTAKVAWPDRLAVSPDGKRLLVPLNLADRAAVVDVASKAVRYVPTGTYPYGAAILPDGKRGLVSNESPGTVSVVDLDSATKVKDIQVGPHLSHPEAIAVDPKADRAYVAIANSDLVAVIDTKKLVVERTLSVERPEGLGTAPIALTVTPAGDQLLVADSGEEAIAVFALPDGRPGGPAPWSLIGRIPTAQYPADVQVAGPRANPCGLRTGPRRGKRVPRCAKLVYISAKGLGTGPNPNGPQPNSPDDSDDYINRTQYLPLLNIGTAGLADYPSRARIAALTKTADAEIHPTNPETAPADTPLRPGGPIKHVFYIVRENRTYDQILGDDPRGDGDPKLALFGGNTTPNAHALAQRFPLLDHVYANSEASIDGHFWTAAAKVSDYVQKNWFQNYGGRGRPYDFGVYAVTWPGNGFLFDQADRQGISYFNYGEAVAGVVPFPDKDRTSAETRQVLHKFLNSDLGAADVGPAGALPQCYPNDASVGDDAVNKQLVWDATPPAASQVAQASRFQCFNTRFQLQLSTGSVPTFNYLVLSNDHTQTLSAGKRTPQAMIADNDQGLGEIVDAISHSSIWKESAIFVIEDDSQDGADHVDAHRMPAFVISPFAKQGAVIHTRYDMLSVIRSMELIMGMKPLGFADALATPMYDAFQGQPSNDQPYTSIPAKVDRMALNPTTGPGARAAARLPTGLDEIPQREMDRLLWKSVHGWNSQAPPPGPNAVKEESTGDG